MQSFAETSNESSGEKHDTHEESNSIPNEGLMIERTVPTRLIENIAATRIQNAFRSFMVHYAYGAGRHSFYYFVCHNFHSSL